MKIKLISPKMTLRPMDSEFKRVMSPSLALLILAALTPNEHEVYIEDENVGKLHLEDKPDLVGISVNVDTSKRAHEISKHYRKQGIKVILGGIHVSANPDEALAYADSVCVGEAEELWEQILADVQTGDLKNKYYNDQPTNLANTPIPKWSLINQSKYLYTNVVVTSRGCPFRCEFCYNSCAYVHNKFRNRPTEHVIEEVKALGTRQVMFIDDNFIGNISWTKEFLKQIKPLNLKWHAAVSVNLVQHLDLLDELKESGCESLFIGFETINKASLESVSKYQNNIESYEKLIQEIHSRGIMINASLVFGFDDDEHTVFEETLNWLVKNKIETMTAHILTPYPGTKIYQRLKSESRIIDNEPTHYNTSYAVFSPNKMTRQQLYEGYLKIYEEFYSIKNIIKRLPNDRNQRVPYLLFNFFYRKFGKIVSKIASIGLMNYLGKLARRLSYGID
ncbi:MAG: radical SAM protein [Desulfotomaculaceae bacterium]|nr:radical SAM protein [Desulfotomaculaceae bacterium]